VVAVAVGRRRLADQLGEAGAERAERRTADGQAHVGDGEVAAAQQCLRPLDAPRHQVRVRRLAVRLTELPGEVRGGHQRGPGEHGDVERARVLAVYQVAGPAQPREVGELLWRHYASVTAAGIINRCADPVAGKLLSGIAAGNPARARKILEMVTTERAARLLDQMSSLAAASALSLPTPTGAVRMLGQADDLTAAGVLLEMSAPSAAGLVTAMDADRAVKLLGQAAPVTVAGILRNVPAERRRLLLSRLSEPFRSLVARHL
jgi:hypothetical protein